MDIATRSYIDPLIDLYEVEKLPEIKITVDKSPEENKKKEPKLPREAKKAYDELIAAFVFVKERLLQT